MRLSQLISRARVMSQHVKIRAFLLWRLRCVSACARASCLIGPGLSSRAADLLRSCAIDHRGGFMAAIQSARPEPDVAIRRRFIERWLPPLLTCVIVLALWEAAVRLLHIAIYLLPPPSVIFGHLLDQIGTLSGIGFYTF